MVTPTRDPIPNQMSASRDTRKTKAPLLHGVMQKLVRRGAVQGGGAPAVKPTDVINPRYGAPKLTQVEHDAHPSMADAQKQPGGRGNPIGRVPATAPINANPSTPKRTTIAPTNSGLKTTADIFESGVHGLTKRDIENHTNGAKVMLQGLPSYPGFRGKPVGRS